MIAHRHLAHPLEDDQLDLGDVREVDERREFLVVARSHGIGNPVDDVRDDRIGRQAVARRMRAEPDAMAEHVRRQFLDVLRLAPPSRSCMSSAQTLASRPQQMIARGDAPRSTPRSTSVGRRMRQPVGVRVVGPGGRDETLDVLAEPLVQEHLLVDARRAAR